MNAQARAAYINARIIDPVAGTEVLGSILTVGDKIWAVGPDAFDKADSDGTLIVDCQGKCLCPGFVDMHVFLGESMDTTAQSAAAGGVTTIVIQPDMNPVLDQVSLVDYIERQARDAIVRVHPMAAATKGMDGREMTEIGLLQAAGALAFTDSRKSVHKAQVMRRLLTYATVHNALIVQHAEEPDLADGGVMNEGETSTRLGLPGVPAEAEVMMIERDLHLVAMTGAKYHVSIVTTAQSIDAVRRAKAKGLAVTCGTAPPYFALNELAIEDYRTFARLSPPLRTEADRLAVIDGLADGTIDVIVSSHDPHSEDEKRLPFSFAAPGVVGLETILPMIMEVANGGHVPLPRLINALTAAPAELLGLPVGRLDKGAPADLLIFDPNIAYRIHAEDFVSGAKNSPFDTRPAEGRVLKTIVAGQSVYAADGW
ncbi:MAG: dihydroorotase [Alphaproteobacteria bacterium]|nr:MAG: dihydroorotase [Alphaproteobacteria bacterium]